MGREVPYFIWVGDRYLACKFLTCLCVAKFILWNDKVLRHGYVLLIFVLGNRTVCTCVLFSQILSTNVLSDEIVNIQYL